MISGIQLSDASILKMKQRNMGEEDIKRQALNVFRMKLLGARVVPVSAGTRTLKDATSEAIREWITTVETTHYIIGSVVGPHPYPMIVRDFQRIIGDEAEEQIMEMEKRMPDACVACVGGGSNAMGLFYPFVQNENVKLVGVEAAGLGIETGKHGATLSHGSAGVLHGMMSYLLHDDDGQVREAHSISAGLDYPGVGPEHAYLKDIGRARYESATDEEAMAGFRLLNRTEGILPALESSHAVGWVAASASNLPKDGVVLINLSGRGDKDINTVARIDGIDLS